jgi:hypothetical protein
MSHRSNKSKMWVCAALCLLSLGGTASSAENAGDKQEHRPKKHVLFFLIDDLGFADVGYHGNSVGGKVLTPTIDALSADGVSFYFCLSMHFSSCLSLHQEVAICAPFLPHLFVWLNPHELGGQGHLAPDATCVRASVVGSVHFIVSGQLQNFSVLC